MLLDVKCTTFVGMNKYVNDYIVRVQLIMYNKHGIKVSKTVIKTVVVYFLRNVIVSMYNQIPIKITNLFRIRIYPHKYI